jgi:hypothetical protein
MAQGSLRPGRAAVAGGVPPGSRIAARLPGAHFHDAWAVALSADAAASPAPVLALYVAVARRTPAWIEACMALRNRVVRPLGLKDLGRLGDLPPGKPAADYRVGERVGIFTLIEQAPDEVLLGDSDRHLEVVVSLHRQWPAAGGAASRTVTPTAMLTVTTVVHLKNRLGRLYMLPVRPVHGLIARTLTTALARPLQPAGL